MIAAGTHGIDEGLVVNALVAEFAVTDWQMSLRFYHDTLGFEVVYDRPEEGFAFLRLGAAQLMIYEIGRDRVLAVGGAPSDRPLGRGVNLQIQTKAVAPLIDRLAAAGIDLVLPLEERWYRAGSQELGVRQFAVADPNGYFLRFSESIGRRSAPQTANPTTTS